jgi:SLT domain-containing protein
MARSSARRAGRPVIGGVRATMSAQAGYAVCGASGRPIAGNPGGERLARQQRRLQQIGQAHDHLVAGRVT